MTVDVVLAALATFVVTIDPIGVVPIFLSLTAHLPAAKRRAIAIKGVVTGTVILLLFALAGDSILGALGISMPAFRIAGGLLLLWIAAEMLFERRNRRRAQSAETLADDDGDEVAVFPLAVPLLAGPGAITATVLLMSAAAGDPGQQAMVLGALVVTMMCTFGLLLLAARVASLIPSSLTDVITRLLGLLLAALAVQFVLDGVFNAVRGAGLVP